MRLCGLHTSGYKSPSPEILYIYLFIYQSHKRLDGFQLCTFVSVVYHIFIDVCVRV